jgi:aspartyl-tRNA(Asn)/glutamyl-tRNA(Gln) amidotransferase subunit A
VDNYFLSRIAEQDKKINAFLSVDKKRVIAQAKKAEENFIKQDETNFLTGVPAAVKDNILIKNSTTTAGSKILENYRAPYDATVIKKLREKGPVVIMGKTNLDEFAMGSSTEHSAFYPTKNPYDTERVPGGSSGGSAAAVAAGECFFSLGSETNGSVRLPAAFCGVVGLKPTYRSVSRSGLIAMASSLDVIGPMAKTVKETALIFETISGRDDLDSTSFEDYDVLSNEQIFSRNPKKLKIGIPKEYFPKELDPSIQGRIKEIINKLANRGFSIQTVSLPYTEYALAAYYIIMPAEVSANLARYDGMRYGLSVCDKKEKSILNTYLQSRKNGFGPEVKRRIMLGTYVLSSGYYDAYYAKAQEIRELIKKEFEEVFKQVDILLAPVAPSLPFKFGEKKNPVDMYLTDIFTSPSSLAGLPAISLPSGKTNGLPTAIQIIGKLFKEEDIFILAHYIEKILKT